MPANTERYPLIVKRVVDSLSEAGGRPSRMIDTSNRAPEATSRPVP